MSAPLRRLPLLVASGAFAIAACATSGPAPDKAATMAKGGVASASTPNVAVVSMSSASSASNASNASNAQVDAAASVLPAATVAPPEPTAEPIDVEDPADDASKIAANAYGALTDAECHALLDKRGIPYVKVAAARGVETPIRFTGPLHGVDLHGGEPVALRDTSPSEIVDCRLALALDDFAAILADHQVVEAVHWSIYRAPPAGEDGPRADHQAGLAIDLGALFEADGSRTGVLEDWRGEVGAKTCGNGAYPVPATKRAWRLRAILCATAAAHIFHLVLTPNFNAAHHDHFHLEIKRHSTFSLVK